MTLQEARALLLEAGVAERAVRPALVEARWRLLGGQTIVDALIEGRDEQVFEALESFRDGDPV